MHRVCSTAAAAAAARLRFCVFRVCSETRPRNCRTGGEGEAPSVSGETRRPCGLTGDSAPDVRPMGVCGKIGAVS